jgi:hypothetical protein
VTKVEVGGLENPTGSEPASGYWPSLPNCLRQMGLFQWQNQPKTLGRNSGITLVTSANMVLTQNKHVSLKLRMIPGVETRASGREVDQPINNFP